MPTPFSHLLITQRLLHDSQVTPRTQALIHDHEAAFLLGGIVADAKVPGKSRAHTHFYHYTLPMPDHPWLEMMRQYPTLGDVDSPARQAFLAGYVAHLAADEYWSRHMLGPHFAGGNWGDDKRDRFFSLHLLLIHMDERDEAKLTPHTVETLREATPNDWLPFMPDSVICEWRDFIADQIDGDSQTIDIFAGRIGASPQRLAQLAHTEMMLHERLWQHISHDLLHKLEAALYTFSRSQLHTYIDRYLPQSDTE